MVERNGISVRNLYKIFGPDPSAMIDRVRDGLGKEELLEKHRHVLALRDISLEIPAHGIFVIMGLSGSGKSTLIRHFNRLIEPTAGSISIDGRNILELDKDELRALRRNSISMVFQRFALLPHRTVHDNVAFGLRVNGLADGQAKERACRWIEQVGLAGYEDYFPAQLSGGMQQRVGLARALATDADILLMDEPFSALDPLIRADMQDMVLELQAELDKTIIFITHDLEEALKLGDGIAILRDGVLIQQGDAQEIVLQPSDSHVEDFVKNINRARVLRVGSVMAPHRGDRSGLSLSERTVLEDALCALMRENAQTAQVVNAAGHEVGSIELKALVRAMAAPAAVADDVKN